MTGLIAGTRLNISCLYGAERRKQVEVRYMPKAKYHAYSYYWG